MSSDWPDDKWYSFISIIFNGAGMGGHGMPVIRMSIRPSMPSPRLINESRKHSKEDWIGSRLRGIKDPGSIGKLKMQMRLLRESGTGSGLF